MLEEIKSSQNLYVSMTPTRTVQSFLDAKKKGSPIPEEVWKSLHGYRKWDEPDLIGLRNASAYAPEILFEEGMDAEIERLLAEFKKKIVPHKF